MEHARVESVLAELEAVVNEQVGLEHLEGARLAQALHHGAGDHDETAGHCHKVRLRLAVPGHVAALDHPLVVGVHGDRGAVLRAKVRGVARMVDVAMSQHDQSQLVGRAAGPDKRAIECVALRREPRIDEDEPLAGGQKVAVHAAQSDGCDVLRHTPPDSPRRPAVYNGREHDMRDGRGGAGRFERRPAPPRCGRPARRRSPPRRPRAPAPAGRRPYRARAALTAEGRAVVSASAGSDTVRPCLLSGRMPNRNRTVANRRTTS